jgi:hypothetical protein
MARALMGHVGPAKDQLLASEIIRLRRRVTELEAEVTRLRETRTADLDLHDELASELHRITETAQPVLA